MMLGETCRIPTKKKNGEKECRLESQDERFRPLFLRPVDPIVSGV